MKINIKVREIVRCKTQIVLTHADYWKSFLLLEHFCGRLTHTGVERSNCICIFFSLRKKSGSLCKCGYENIFGKYMYKVCLLILSLLGCNVDI